MPCACVLPEYRLYARAHGYTLKLSPTHRPGRAAAYRLRTANPVTSMEGTMGEEMPFSVVQHYPRIVQFNTRMLLNHVSSPRHTISVSK